MSFDFDFAMDDGLGIGMVVYYLLTMLFSGGLSIAMYVFRSLGVYTIAKRRELKNPWMAWVPVVDYWLLGSISDQYQYVVKGKNKNKRKWMLGVNIAMWVAYAAFWVMYIVMIVGLIAGIGFDSYVNESAMLEDLMGGLIGILVVCLPLLVLSITLSVLRYMALYDLYRSVDPNNSVLYLVLSILVSVAEPFFIFFNRKKDLGMPPRKNAAPEHIPQESAAPVYEAEPVPVEPFAGDEDFASPEEAPVAAEEPAPAAEPTLEAEPVAEPAEEPAAESVPAEEAPAEPIILGAAPEEPAEAPGPEVDPWDL